MSASYRTKTSYGIIQYHVPERYFPLLSAVMIGISHYHASKVTSHNYKWILCGAVKSLTASCLYMCASALPVRLFPWLI
jgi:hypothetical protein